LANIRSSALGTVIRALNTYLRLYVIKTGLADTTIRRVVEEPKVNGCVASQALAIIYAGITIVVASFADVC